MHLRPRWHAFNQDDQTVLLATPQDRSRWNNRQLYYFSVDMDATHDLLWHSMDPRLSFNERTRLLGVGTGSSVLIPKNLFRQALQEDLEFGYDSLDGCFDLDGRLHSSLIDADLPESGGNFAFGKGPSARIIAPSTIGCNEKLEIGAQECHEGIMLSDMLHISDSLVEIALRPRLNPARQPLLSDSCPHKPTEPFDPSELRRIQSPEGPPIAYEGAVGQLRCPGGRIKDPRLMVDNMPPVT